MLRLVLILAILADGLALPMPANATALPPAAPAAGLPDAPDPHADHRSPAGLQPDATVGDELPTDSACQDTAPCASLCAHAVGVLSGARLAGPALPRCSRSPARGRLLYQSHHADLLTRPPIHA